jgi:hypothetical protein
MYKKQRRYFNFIPRRQRNFFFQLSLFLWENLTVNEENALSIHLLISILQIEELAKGTGKCLEASLNLDNIVQSMINFYLSNIGISIHLDFISKNFRKLVLSFSFN